MVGMRFRALAADRRNFAVGVKKVAVDYSYRMKLLVHNVGERRPERTSLARKAEILRIRKADAQGAQQGLSLSPL